MSSSHPHDGDDHDRPRATSAKVRSTTARPRKVVLLATSVGGLAFVATIVGLLLAFPLERSSSPVGVEPRPTPAEPTLAPTPLPTATTVAEEDNPGKRDATNAIASLAAALASRPEDTELRRQLGLAYIAAGQNELAEEQYRAALAISPADHELRYHLGNLLGRMARLEEAEQQLREALRLEPKHAPTHYNMGILLQRTKKPTEALKHFQQAVEIEPDYWEAHFSLGMTQVLLLNLEPAANAFREVLRVRPGFEPAQNILNRLESELKQSP